jgi:DNA-binding YbaB/EbfC family protein
MKMNQILKQAEQLQKQLKKQQDELATKEFEATAGGGMVTARVNGKSELLSIKIEPDVVDKEDIGMLEDLVVAAVSEALRRAQEEGQGDMMNMMGEMGLKMPGMF